MRVGRHVRLTPLDPSHFRSLHAIVVNSPFSLQWRSRGKWIPLGDFERFLSAQLAWACVISSRSSDDLAGIVEILSHDPVARHAELSVFCPGLQTGVAIEAVAIFCDEVFDRFGLDRLFLSASDTSLKSLGLARNSDIARYCGTLRQYVPIAGRLEDIHLYEIERAHFVNTIGKYSALQMSPPGWKTSGTYRDAQ